MFISLIKGPFGLNIEEGQTDIRKDTVENNIHIAHTEHSENTTQNSFRNIYTSLLTGLFSLDIRKGDPVALTYPTKRIATLSRIVTKVKT